MRIPILAACLLASLAPAQENQGKKLQIYILAGQSNMQGHAKVSTIGYVGEDPATAALHDAMLDERGAPRVRDDVWISYLTAGRGGDGEGSGPLTAGFGARNVATEAGDKIGPEFTFGTTVGDAIDAPVLLIKTAWGGKSLNTDFRPPSAGPYPFGPHQLEQLEKQGKLEQAKADKEAATGVYYRKMIDHVRHVLDDPARVCPAYDPQAGYELSGFVWFQGWNDMVDRGTYPERGKPGGYEAYSTCMAHFIRDVRRDLEAPALPFVIGVMGVGGPLDPEDRYAAIHGGFREAMAAPAAMPEFVGNVLAVRTAPFWDAKLQEIADLREVVGAMQRKLRTKHKDGPNADGSMSAEEQKAFMERFRNETVGAENEAIWRRGASNQAYHYLGCAKTMAQIGEAFARALLDAR